MQLSSHFYPSHGKQFNELRNVNSMRVNLESTQYILSSIYHIVHHNVSITVNPPYLPDTGNAACTGIVEQPTLQLGKRRLQLFRHQLTLMSVSSRVCYPIQSVPLLLPPCLAHTYQCHPSKPFIDERSHNKIAPSCAPSLLRRAMALPLGTQ